MGGVARVFPDWHGHASLTVVLACPDGTVFTYDKDFPTHVYESAFYAGGEDAAYVEALATLTKCAPRADNNSDGAFTHAGIGIGASLCWESVRNRTAKRLVGKADIVLAASGWWTVDPDKSWEGMPIEFSRSTWAESQSLIVAAPQRLASTGATSRDYYFKETRVRLAR